ncbi:hypothetical protein ACFFX0_26660 [Citricoccus parietis]|uniref:Uncharacterized protein n=1 Tax=Citricoccus parietis TaxID=592307 RepID=A0ABV5G6K7_9MICC
MLHAGVPRAPHGGLDVQPDGAAGTGMFQSSLSPLWRRPGPDGSAHQQAVLHQVVQHQHGLGIGSGQHVAGLLTAEGIEGADDGEVHDQQAT